MTMTPKRPEPLLPKLSVSIIQGLIRIYGRLQGDFQDYEAEFASLPDKYDTDTGLTPKLLARLLALNVKRRAQETQGTVQLVAIRISKSAKFAIK